jgi:group I intron endonuclease
MIVYKVINKINGMSYIGQTNRDIQERWTEHCKPALQARSYLSNAIQKYGKENFEIQELKKATSQEELDDLEDKVIKEHCTMWPNGYNLRNGGSGGSLSEEAKRKIGNASRGRKQSPELIAKITKSRKATHHKRATFDDKQAKCGHCLQWKDKNDFNKNKSRASGVQSRCKICRVEYRPDFKRALKA